MASILTHFITEHKKSQVKLIKESLTLGYGTLVFDGWEDQNKRSVLNVLLKTEGELPKARRFFFLKVFSLVQNQ